MHWGGTSHATLVNRDLLTTLAKQAGCSHLLYGYESFSARVMKTIGKGATPETNERSLRWTVEAGIRPIPNQMFGFPDEDFDSIYDNVKAWERLGLQVKPFFVTPYPGTEWYYTNKPRILEQYGRRPRSLPARSGRRHPGDRGHLQEVQRGRALWPA